MNTNSGNIALFIEKFLLDNGCSRWNVKYGEKIIIYLLNAKEGIYEMDIKNQIGRTKIQTRKLLQEMKRAGIVSIKKESKFNFIEITAAVVSRLTEKYSKKDYILFGINQGILETNSVQSDNATNKSEIDRTLKIKGKGEGDDMNDGINTDDSKLLIEKHKKEEVIDPEKQSAIPPSLLWKLLEEGLKNRADLKIISEINDKLKEGKIAGNYELKVEKEKISKLEIENENLQKEIISSREERLKLQEKVDEIVESNKNEQDALKEDFEKKISDLQKKFDEVIAEKETLLSKSREEINQLKLDNKNKMEELKKEIQELNEMNIRSSSELQKLQEAEKNSDIIKAELIKQMENVVKLQDEIKLLTNEIELLKKERDDQKNEINELKLKVESRQELDAKENISKHQDRKKIEIRDEKINLTSSEEKILTALAFFGGKATRTQISEQTGTDRSYLTDVLRKLEIKKYIEKGKNKRNTIISLTDSGKDYLKNNQEDFPNPKNILKSDQKSIPFKEPEEEREEPLNKFDPAEIDSKEQVLSDRLSEITSVSLPEILDTAVKVLIEKGSNTAEIAWGTLLITVKTIINNPLTRKGEYPKGDDAIIPIVKELLEIIKSRNPDESEEDSPLNEEECKKEEELFFELGRKKPLSVREKIIQTVYSHDGSEDLFIDKIREEAGLNGFYGDFDSILKKIIEEGEISVSDSDNEKTVKITPKNIRKIIGISKGFGMAEKILNFLRSGKENGDDKEKK